jgi:CHASE2 domain-containing sensor protein
MTYLKYILGLTILAGQSCYSQNIEDSVVLIGVGDYDRGIIADQIAIINTLNPKVISIDVAFPDYKGNKADKKLVSAIVNSKQVVIPSEISSMGTDYYGKETIMVSLTCAGEYFFSGNAVSGFVSVEKEKDKQTIPSKFIQWQESMGYKYRHFSIETAMLFDSLRTNEFIMTHDRLVDIDFRNGKRKFKTFKVQDVLKHRLTKADIEGKIVMLGFLGPGDQDKHISPLNTSSNEPDMYGLEYLAHIVAQILEKKIE